jgi:hypothetical protein
MREMTVFNYSELNAEAQEKARDEFRNNREYHYESEYIKENFEEYLRELGLPHEDVEFSLSYCQGDGVAFYGRVNTTADLLDKLDLTDDSRMFIEQAQGSGWTIDADIVRNSWANRYAHWNTMNVETYVDDAASIAEDVFEDDLSEFEGGTDEYSEQLAHYVDLIEIALDELETALTQYVQDTSRELEAQGYAEYEYYDSDEYIAEELEANEYEYTAEGARV